MCETVDMKSLKIRVISRLFFGYSIMGLLFFLSAGTLKYWEGWIYMIVLAVPMIFFGVYMFKHDPEFLERRMKMKEKREKQKLIVILGIIPFLFTFMLPGFDRRFGWSSVPTPVTIAGLVVVLLGYLSILHVFRTNTFASRVVEVEDEQKLITTGPYARVRHPMYTSIMILYLFTPLALGSYWAVIPALSILPVLIARILDEEKELLDNLEGYREYIQKVKHRLLPGIW